jgi:hypothetical protein
MAFSPARAIKTNLHRRIELAQDLPGALRKGVGSFGGQVDALFGARGDKIYRDEDEKHRNDANRGVKIDFESFFLHDELAD